MKLLIKFNLIYVVVMAIGVGASGCITRDLLISNARQLIEQAKAERN